LPFAGAKPDRGISYRLAFRFDGGTCWSIFPEAWAGRRCSHDPNVRGILFR